MTNISDTIQFSKFSSNSNIPVIITLFLAYHSYLFSLFTSSIRIAYGISFLLYCMAIFYHNKNLLLNVNKWLFSSTLVVTISILLGLGMGWNNTDILADTARFLAPFVGYVAGLIVLKHLPYHKLITIFYIFGLVELLLYYISLSNKLLYVAQGGPIFEYAKNGLTGSFLYFFLFLCFLKYKIIKGFTRVLIIGYLLGMALNPIMLLSKARTISLVVAIVLVFFCVAKYRFKLFILIFILILMSILILNSSSDVIFNRFNNFITVFETGKYHDDASTSFRVVEIINVTSTLIDTIPYSLLFGLGSGALYYDTYATIKGGVHLENFRPDGGVHHIFFAYLAYLFRYGFVGLMLILCWILSVVYKLNKVSHNTQLDNFSNSVILSIKLYILIMLISDIFVPVNIYGNMSFGYILALSQTLAQKGYLASKQRLFAVI